MDQMQEMLRQVNERDMVTVMAPSLEEWCNKGAATREIRTGGCVVGAFAHTPESAKTASQEESRRATGRECTESHRGWLLRAIA